MTLSLVELRNRARSVSAASTASTWEEGTEVAKEGKADSECSGKSVASAANAKMTADCGGTHRSPLEKSILTYMSLGMNAERVAALVGVSPSRISQLLSDEDFREEVGKERAIGLLEARERDKRIDRIEDKCLDRLEQSIQSSLSITKPMEAARIVQIVNGLKRRGGGELVGGQSVEASNVVTLVLPLVTQNKFVINGVGQVVEVEGQTLVTLPSGGLAGLAKARSVNSLSSLSSEDFS